MMTIWKYKLPEETRFTLDLPTSRRLLTVQVQGDDVCLWALVDPDSPPARNAFRVFLTGEPIDRYDLTGSEYIGTFQRDWFVGHLFRVL